MSRDRRFQELKDWLIEREYPTGVIDAAIAKARAIPRSVASAKAKYKKQTCFCGVL